MVSSHVVSVLRIVAVSAALIGPTPAQAQPAAIDSQCAERMLWKFGAMARIATTKGIMTSLRFAPEMQGLLEKDIALRPTHADSPFDTTLGNLHYAAAVFYRVVPRLGVARHWLLGVTSDEEDEPARAVPRLSPRPSRRGAPSCLRTRPRAPRSPSAPT